MKYRNWYCSALILMAIVLVGVVYRQLPPSKKRYIQYLSQQFPHLLPRYFV